MLYKKTIRNGCSQKVVSSVKVKNGKTIGKSHGYDTRLRSRSNHFKPSRIFKYVKLPFRYVRHAGLSILLNM